MPKKNENQNKNIQNEWFVKFVNFIHYFSLFNVYQLWEHLLEQIINDKSNNP
jgi:hypothetical protein